MDNCEDPRKWNVSNPNRKPRYSPYERFEGISKEPNHINQYTKQSPEKQFDDDYRRLVQVTREKSSSGGCFKCWIVPPKTRGYDTNNGGYTRMNHRGQKIMSHMFSWLYHHPGQSVQGSVSHLCETPNCVRPDHLHCEPMTVNNSRSTCVGWVAVLDKQYKLCKHDPPCKKVITVGQNNSSEIIPDK